MFAGASDWTETGTGSGGDDVVELTSLLTAGSDMSMISMMEYNDSVVNSFGLCR